MQTCLLADGIARINNAQKANKRVVILLFSNLIERILNILMREGYIDNKIKYYERKGVARIQVYLRYTDNSNPVISEFKLISKPGCRVYASYKALPKEHNGLGIVILSTALGVMTDYEAIKCKYGGEVLCSIF